MFMALKIFSEEETMEESSSYSFSSSISTASNYSIDSNSVGADMSSESSCCSMDNHHIDQFIRHDYSSKRREIEIARLNVMVYLRLFVCMYVWPVADGMPQTAGFTQSQEYFRMYNMYLYV
jgi:hypothetical protein